jgi:hypothetical protein
MTGAQLLTCITNGAVDPASVAAEMGVAECFAADGVACIPWYLVKDRSGAVSLPLRTLLLEGNGAGAAH